MKELFAHILYAENADASGMEVVFVEDIPGLRVRLPITGTEASVNRAAAEEQLRRALDALAERQIEIALLPDGLTADMHGIAEARAADVLPFLLPRALHKALQAIGKHPARAEIALFCENTASAERVLIELSLQASFVTLVGDAAALEAMQPAAGRVFRNTGLQAVMTENAATALARAEAVLHTAPPSKHYTHHYRKDCVRIDLSGCRAMTAALLARRGDMLAADGLYASLGKTTFLPDALALVLYGKSPAFAQLARRDADADADAVRAELQRLRVTVVAFAQAGRALSVAGLMRRAAAMQGYAES